MNYGFLEPLKKATNWVFGDKNIPDEVIFPDGHGWGDFLPPAEFQSTATVETKNCSAYGWTAAIEMFLKKKYNDATEWSERALGIMAGTSYLNGNDPDTVAETIRKQGLIPDIDLPFHILIKTPQEYYSPRPLPQNLLDKAKEFPYDFLYDSVIDGTVPNAPDLLKEALRYSPLPLSVFAWKQDEKGLYEKAGNPNHWPCIYDYKEGEYWNVFDSYLNNYKRLEWQYPFTYVKRIWLGKKAAPAPQNFLMKILSAITEFFNWWAKSILK